MLLENRGYSVDAVANGMEAIEAAEKVPYDLILMDVQMPEMDGFEATCIIKELLKKTGRRIPIIAMTAHAMKGDMERCLEAGMDDYISKPVQPEILYNSIERQLLGKKEYNPGREADTNHTTPMQNETKPSFQNIIPDHKAFDKKALLDRLDGDEELLAEIIDVYLQDVPVQIARIRQALEEKNMETIERQSHTLKGASANVNAETLRKVALDIELAAKEGDIDKARASIQHLESEFIRLQEILERERLAAQ